MFKTVLLAQHKIKLEFKQLTLTISRKENTESLNYKQKVNKEVSDAYR